MEAPGHESIIDQVKDLLSSAVDETQPYKQLYAASDLLQAELDKLKGADGADEAEAWLKAQKGLCLLDTDLRQEGE
eukprot:scaffold14804_cov19-Tisochrysis_lutea.AAC.1